MGYIICDIPKTNCNLREADNSCRLNIKCLPVIDRCEGTDSSEETGGRKCKKIDNGYCTAYYNPSSKWVADRHCPIASHYETEEQQKKKTRIGQQKSRKPLGRR